MAAAAQLGSMLAFAFIFTGSSLVEGGDFLRANVKL